MLFRSQAAFEDVARSLLSPADLTRTLEVDGALETGYYSLDAARMLQGGVWGQGFPQPLFAERFEVESQRLLQDKHLKLRLRNGAARHEAIWFNAPQAVPEHIYAAFRLSVNEFRGTQTVQLTIEHCEPA